MTISCIFHCLRRGILRFFCRHRFHGEIPRSKSPVLQISEKEEKWAFSYGKIRPLEMIVPARVCQKIKKIYRLNPHIICVS